jgi:anti-anti-sigma regulatory factor
LKIESDSQGGRTTLRLIGHFQSEDLGELQNQLQHNGPRFVFDLKEVTLVDADVVRFLGTYEAGGVEIVNCSLYIREWMRQERKG